VNRKQQVQVLGIFIVKFSLMVFSSPFFLRKLIPIVVATIGWENMKAWE